MDRPTKIRKNAAIAGAVLALLAAPVAQAAPVLVFGLPLGGKLAESPRLCPHDSEQAKAVCWVGKPFSDKRGYRSGAVHLPNPEGRPAWATHALFDVTIAADGLLESVSAKALLGHGTARPAITDSISARFGPPARSSQYGAEWDRLGTHARMLCSAGEWCSVTFESARSYAASKQEAAANEQREAKRPKSP